MSDPVGSTWTPVVVVIVATVVVVVLLLRYRALVRAGSGLPPGAGGARLVGVVGSVVAAHDPAGGDRGVVHVLGDDWQLADEVGNRLGIGASVVVTRVVGTRLVVVPAPDGGGRATGDARPDRPAPPVRSPDGNRDDAGTPE